VTKRQLHQLACVCVCLHERNSMLPMLTLPLFCPSPCPLCQIDATRKEAAAKFKQEIMDSLRQKATQVNDMFHMLVHA